MLAYDAPCMASSCATCVVNFSDGKSTFLKAVQNPLLAWPFFRKSIIELRSPLKDM